MFAAFAQQLTDLNRRTLRVLELGSGPGFLAEFLLARVTGLDLTLLDFSAPMQDLATARLGQAPNIAYVLRSFKAPDWSDGLGLFDAVITNQAVHELRHKRYAISLHRQVKLALRPAGCYIVCDHYFGIGGMNNDQLYMTIEEQQAAFSAAGFDHVRLIQRAGTLVMHRVA